MHFNTRPGTNKDRAWLFNLYKTTMHTYIDKTWGWEDTFHQNAFDTNLHPSKFTIVIVDEKDTGAYLVYEKSESFWLEMIMVHPDIHNCGLGTAILKKLQADSKKLGKPLRLSVLKVNSAKKLYTRLGFTVYDEDESSFMMQWN